MKKLFLLLLLLFAPNLFADLNGEAACPTGALGNSVTCVKNQYYDSITTPQTAVAGTHVPTSYTDGYVVFGYTFCSAACDRSMTMTFGTNQNNPDSCFVASANSPMKVGPNGVVYMWYCPKPTASSGIATLNMNCANNTGSCGFLSYFSYELSGACTTAPCIDKTGLLDDTTSSIQSVTVSTSAAVAYTNELSSAFCTNNNNEVISVSSPYVQIFSSTQETSIPGNQVGALGIGTGVASATMTWTGNDGVVCAIMTVKTPSSASVAGNKTAMPCVIGDAMSEHREVYAWIREDDEV